MKNKEISPGALRAAEMLTGYFDADPPHYNEIAQIIDRETSLKELIEALEDLFECTQHGMVIKGETLEWKEHSAMFNAEKALAKAKGGLIKDR